MGTSIKIYYENPTIRKGVSYEKLYIHDDKRIESSINLGNNKVKMKGSFTVTLVKGNNLKYGEQLQFNVYHKKTEKLTRKDQRNESQYNSTEIFLPIEYIEIIADYLKNRARS